MKNKTIFIVLTCLAVIALVVGLSFKSYNNSGRNIALTEDKLITNETLINMIVNDMESPLGNKLIKVVLEDDGAYVSDRGWKYAYQVCTSNEHNGWIYVHSGKTGQNKLYGPYEWCLI